MQPNLEFSTSDMDDGARRDDRNPGRRTPLTFWETDRLFTCPVVGMCLTLTEQKQLLKKARVSLKNRGLFEIHETLVGSSESANRLSRKVDNLLNRKFSNEVASLFNLDEREFMGHWRTCFGRGDYQGVLWAAATRPDLSIESRREIFGMVHMDMHGYAERSAKLKQKLSSQQDKVSAMHQSIREAVRARRALQKENERLSRIQAELKANLTAAEREKARLHDELAGLQKRDPVAELRQENRRLGADLDALSEEVKARGRQMVAFKEQNERLTAELERQRESNARFKKEAQSVIGEVLDLNRCDPSCPSFSLCSKRVLIVGGITRMESLYRQLIEGRGGVLEYHDGYMKSGIKKLESRPKRADVVLCPVSCNSHAACSLVKNLGKKHNKPVHMLANSSLSAISNVIWEEGMDHAAGN